MPILVYYSIDGILETFQKDASRAVYTAGMGGQGDE